eukprot:scaffold15258_cov111-Isochrysis_galbana.AAC.5
MGDATELAPCTPEARSVCSKFLASSAFRFSYAKFGIKSGSSVSSSRSCAVLWCGKSSAYRRGRGEAAGVGRPVAGSKPSALSDMSRDVRGEPPCVALPEAGCGLGTK